MSLLELAKAGGRGRMSGRIKPTPEELELAIGYAYRECSASAGGEVTHQPGPEFHRWAGTVVLAAVRHGMLVRHGGHNETTVLRSYDGVVGNSEPCSHDGAIHGDFLDEPGGRR